MARPWKFYNNMCVRTFVQQAKTMTGRDFKREVSNGKKHDALSDCRTQVEYLVNARNTLMPQPRERMLPSPEVSFSSAAGKVEPARTLLSPEVSFSSTDGNVEEALRSAASALLEPPPSNDAALLETFLPSDGVETEVTQAQAPESSPSGGHGFRDVPYKVVKPPPTVSPRRRNFKPKTPRQLLTPETSFSAEEYEKE
jgi:hypothetical protein